MQRNAFRDLMVALSHHAAHGSRGFQVPVRQSPSIITASDSIETAASYSEAAIMNLPDSLQATLWGKKPGNPGLDRPFASSSPDRGGLDPGWHSASCKAMVILQEADIFNCLSDCKTLIFLLTESMGTRKNPCRFGSYERVDPTRISPSEKVTSTNTALERFVREMSFPLIVLWISSEVANEKDGFEVS